MTTIPPLPEPGLQSLEDRRAIGRWFIQQAREELDKGHRLQAGEKAWGAVAHNLKAVGELRGWRHDSHRHLENIGRQIVAECRDTELGNAISDANHIGHFNFYENQRSPEALRELIQMVEEALPSLEALQDEPPRSFTITSNQQRRRLAELTGNGGLRVGDTSPVGFSLRHQPSGSEGPV